MDTEVKNALEELRSYHKSHTDLGWQLIKADKDLYMVDLLAVATLNRSLRLTLGFCSLIESENFIAAAPLLRLQIDNLLRFSAIFLVSDENEFVLNILNGISIRDQKDISGKKMTDAYLVDKMSAQYPWIKEVYTRTSGYIHLSDMHILNAMQVSITDNTFSMAVTNQDVFVSDDIYIEACAAFRETTNLLLAVLSLWIEVKSKHGKQDSENVNPS